MTFVNIILNGFMLIPSNIILIILLNTKIFRHQQIYEFPPKGSFVISNTEGHNPDMASPFKNKNIDEAVAPKNIKNFIEQSNYTNIFLQFLGDNLFYISV
ncbi:hypothetical protein AHAS_Ahas04G0121800 [Arachis hypogaea]